MQEINQKHVHSYTAPAKDATVLDQKRELQAACVTTTTWLQTSFSLL